MKRDRSFNRATSTAQDSYHFSFFSIEKSLQILHAQLSQEIYIVSQLLAGNVILRSYYTTKHPINKIMQNIEYT